MSLIGRVALALWFLALGGYMVKQAVQRPALNWDIIGYIAASKSMTVTDPVQLHQQTFKLLAESVPAADFQNLTQGEFRGTVFSDPTALAQQLPFYQIRPVYNGLLNLVEHLGGNVASATYLISAVSCALAVFVLWRWSATALPPAMAFAVAPLAVVFGLLEVARLSTPDGLALLSLVGTAYLFSLRRWAWLLLCLPLLVTIRTDLILWVLPVAATVTLTAGAPYRWVAVFSGLLSVLVYGLIGAYFKNPGWATVFYFTLVKTSNHPLAVAPTVDLTLYLNVLAREAKTLLLNKPMVIYSIAAAAGIRLMWLKRQMVKSWLDVLADPPLALGLICMAFIGTHYLAFPAAWERFFCGPQLVACIALMMAAHRGSSRSDLAP